MTSQRMSCPPAHLPTRPPTTRTLDVTATESGTIGVDVSERLSLSGTFVATDKFTKCIVVKPITFPNADRVLDFVDEPIHRYGLPHRIITNLGSNFNNHQFREYCENNGIDV
jgi:hypothetical protein